MANPKMPARDKQELNKLRSLFEKGLNEAAKDPERLSYLRQKREQMIKPWEDYLKDWKPSKKDKKAAERVAARFMAEDESED